MNQEIPELALLRVLVVDDEPPARAKMQRWLSEEPGITVVAEMADGLAAANWLRNNRVDVVFLDIQMPELSGMEVAAQLDGDDAPSIVFVTAHDEHAIKAFELNAIDYILKPYDRSRLRASIERLRKRVRGSAQSAATQALARAQVGWLQRILVPDGERLQLLDCQHIHWLETDDNYVHVHGASGKWTLRKTLQDLLEQLDPQQFVRIHKSAAVNLREIASLEPLFKGDYELLLRSGVRVRLSRRYKDELFARMQ